MDEPSNYPSLQKTKKKKNTVHNKQKMWNMFEDNISEKKKTPIECVYRASGEREFCDNCNGSLLFGDNGYLVCSNDKCGIIYKDALDSTAEWRFYGADDSNLSDPTRCGMPINPLLIESSYGCKISNIGSSYEMRKIRRFAEWQSMPYKEKSQYDEFQRITMMAQNDGINKNIIDDAIRYHKKISEHKTFRGVNRDGIIAASIYISFRINKNPRTAKEIAKTFILDKASATKGCKNAVAIINTIEEKLENNEKSDFGTTHPKYFIERHCSKIGINNELTKLALFIANKIEKNNYIPENTPNSVAAGIIYFIGQLCKLNITKKDVNNISEISEVTINKCYKKLDSLKHQLIPAQIIKKYNII